ncbi:class I SAM-dependent methyltransferase [Sciscionella sediminilitoris]|uniref:class I SAM-dependent methyltransferase n=1 Tax=Sciscionella sediminilitoris TaxID=1445613 RepID=UPI00069227A4|nr:class I SAM-dependent methyltransferase [Sciscionella sp. SE31]
MNVSEVWRLNHPWAMVYSFGIDRPWLAKPTARMAFGSDIGLLYAATEAIGELPAGSAVLDVPCGSGVALRGLRRDQGIRYVAADIAPAMLERTKRTAQRHGVTDQVHTQACDVARMPFADGEFDLCVSLTGLHCFPDPGAAVAEIARVLRPGGALRASWFRTDAGARYRPQEVLGHALGLLGPSASTTQVREWLDECGFTDVRLRVSGALAYVTATKG